MAAAQVQRESEAPTDPLQNPSDPRENALDGADSRRKATALCVSMAADTERTTAQEIPAERKRRFCASVPGHGPPRPRLSAGSPRARRAHLRAPYRSA